MDGGEPLAEVVGVRVSSRHGLGLGLDPDRLPRTAREAMPTWLGLGLGLGFGFGFG